MMHDSDERGVLLVNGAPMPDAVIARRLGLDNQSANQILTTLLDFGVASRRESDGALFCRRMVKDENLRRVRTAAGKKGGNPLLLNQTPNQTPTTGDKQIPTPSFSSSITTSKEKREAADAAPPTPGIENLVGEAKSKPTDNRSKAAAVPTLAEVQAFAVVLQPNSPDAQTEAAAFCDHYASNGWRVSGKTPMADWRASFRGWMRRRPQFQAAGLSGTSQAAPPARARTAPKPADPARWS